MNTIGERLKHYRKLNNLSQAEAARRINVPKSTYRDWERGRLISGEPYHAICKAFGISYHQLLSEDGENHCNVSLVKKTIELLQEVMETL